MAMYRGHFTSGFLVWFSLLLGIRHLKIFIKLSTWFVRRAVSRETPRYLSASSRSLRTLEIISVWTRSLLIKLERIIYIAIDVSPRRFLVPARSVYSMRGLA